MAGTPARITVDFDLPTFPTPELEEQNVAKLEAIEERLWRFIESYGGTVTRMHGEWPDPPGYGPTEVNGG